MKFLFVSDSFKGSLTSAQTIQYLKKAAEEVFGSCECQGIPVADGGEGTIDAVVQACHGEKLSCQVQDPLGREIAAYYGCVGGTAVIEMAQASGLPLVMEAERDPRKTSTYGTGQLLVDALQRGFRDIRIAIGGSATNDGGMGMASALGVRFLDCDGQELKGIGENLELVERIDISGLTPLIRQAKITVMCDVTNPLCGENGATYTFGKQKGGTLKILDQLESGMQHYRDVIRNTFQTDPDQIPGTGAAGGLGAALLIYLGAEMRSGIDCVLDMTNFDRWLEWADLVVTGEGRTDWQSSFGKVMQGIGDRCARKGVPVVGLSGSLGPGYETIYEHGIDSLMTTVDGPMGLDEAMADAVMLYQKAAVRMFRMIRAGMRVAKKDKR